MNLKLLTKTKIRMEDEEKETEEKEVDWWGENEIGW